MFATTEIETVVIHSLLSVNINESFVEEKVHFFFGVVHLNFVPDSGSPPKLFLMVLRNV